MFDEDPTKRRVMKDILLILVVIATLFAAFRSQQAANNSEDASNRVLDIQHQRDAEVQCIQNILFETVQALNERTQFSSQQATSNIDLQKAQITFLRTVIVPHTDPEGRRALKLYLDALNNFVLLNTKTKGLIDEFPFPTPADFSKCLTAAVAEGSTEGPRLGGD